jgi:hypothetical protein
MGLLMIYPLVIACSVLALLFIYQMWVTVLVCRADAYDTKQRILQCLAIWLIPFLAALTCHLMLRSSRAPIKPSKSSIVDQSDNVGAENIGIGSATD